MSIKHRLLCILMGMLLFAGAAQAVEPFDKVADKIRTRHQEALKEKAITIQEIESRKAALLEKLGNLKTDLASVEEKLAEDQVLLENLAGQRDTLKKDISTKLAKKTELDNIFRDHARNFLALAEKSPFSAQNPQRLTILKSYLARDHLFGMKDVRALVDLYFEDLSEGRQKTLYTGTVLDRNGNEIISEIIRLGHITAMYRNRDDTGYLTFSPSSARLLMSAEPPLLVRRSIEDYFQGDREDVPVDISGGIAIRQLARHVTLMDQLRSGGVLVIPILLVGLVALVLTGERLIFLGRVRQNTDALMTRVTQLVDKGDFDGALETTRPHRNRPTGRVLMAGLARRGESREVIESAITEAILKETPRLERFLNALKVSAAVAPLLGLLGTVTGMINTFQVITTHGTGDPRLMAGGISEAMVTTQVGLAVAIPVMMIAAFLGRRAHTLSQDMEEKGLALMGALLKLKTNGIR